MGKVSESIYNDGKVVIPMADVQHIEKLENGGLWVITKHTTWNFERSHWENPIWISVENAEKFLSAWCLYRHELESATLLPCNELIEGKLEETSSQTEGGVE
jgi:hypothetical protein